MGVHKGQSPRITECRGTLFPASITGKRRVQGYTLSCQLIRWAEKSAEVHSFFPVLVIVRRAIV